MGVSKPKLFEMVGYRPHPVQQQFHLSEARFRVACCGRRMGKSTMAARDREASLLLPNTRGWIVGPCVDEETEILTQRGWLRFNEVREGDQTLSVNPVTGLSEWDIVEKVLLNPGIHDVIRMEGYSFSSVSTPDHRWLTQRRMGIGYREQGSKLPKSLRPIAHLLPKTANGWTWRTTSTLTADDRIPRAAPCATLPTESKYTDAFVELAAWLWTEGSVEGRDKSTYCIHQSNVVNPENVVRIRRALQEICPSPVLSHSRSTIATSYWSETVRSNDPSHTVFRLGKVLSSEFRIVFESHKIVAVEFIKSLTAAQLQLFVDVSLLADGTIGRGSKDGYDTEQAIIYQDNEEQLFAVQLACSLLGIPTSLRRRTKDGKNGWVLGLLTKQFVNPKRATYVAGPNGMKIGGDNYVGTVWCVTTRNGNWLAKRKHSVYYTGNTYDKQTLEKKSSGSCGTI